MNELISKINRFGAREKDEQSLLLKVGEICRDAAATFTTKKKRKHQLHRLYFHSKERRLKRKSNDCFVKRINRPKAISAKPEIAQSDEV